MVGIVRSAQLVVTLVTIAPFAVMGLFSLYTGDLAVGTAFLGFALAVVLASEYLYLRLVSDTVGRLKYLGGIPERLRNVRE